MRPCRAALALAALVLAACSGGAATPEATPTPPPAAVATPEAASTPAPTAVATPEATSTPEATPTPTPEQACANGVAVADPDALPLLVADCEMLLRAKDALRGDASLDWGGGLAIADWEGVTVGGEPLRVTGLDLRGKGLTGSIPRALRRLRLDETLFAGNALTGCVPSAFEDASGDAASLGLPWCLRYDRLDATGEVTTAGSWAILDGSGEALATWEGLRSEAATLRVHQTDTGGSSWASEFGAVAADDLFEWRKASDCWVRYRVAGAPARPSGASGRWEFPIEWMTYSYTGAGCEGAVGATTVLRVDEAPLPVTLHAKDTPSFVADMPVRHGPWLLHPLDWADRSIFEVPVGRVPTKSLLGEGQSDPDAWLPPAASVSTTSLVEARKLQFWRDPVLPTGARFWRAEAGLKIATRYGYRAFYGSPDIAVEIRVYFLTRQPFYTTVYHQGNEHGIVKEARVIDGLPALLEYSPPGTRYDRYFSSKAYIFDPATGLMYHANAWSAGFDIEAIVEIVRSPYQTAAS